MRRRRIRELVAAALADYCGEPTRPDEITVTVRRDAETERRVEVDVLWGLIQAASKREALRLALAAHGWKQKWPALDDVERSLVRDGGSLDLLALPPWEGRDRPGWPELLLRHLREPVALPGEAPCG